MRTSSPKPSPGCSRRRAPCSGPRPGLHEPERLQHPERLPDRRPRDAELRRELTLRREALAGGEPPGRDLRLEPREHLLEGAPGHAVRYEGARAIASTSTTAPRGSRATPTVARAGAWSPNAAP